jgi:thymidylate synthase (methanogen type)
LEIASTRIEEAWSQAMYKIAEEGEVSESDGKKTREVLNVSITVKCPEGDFSEPVVHVQQLKKWVYPSTSDIASFFFSKESQILHKYSYGERIFSYSGLKNQVDDYIIPLLKSSPGTRRAIISIYNPVLDSYQLNKESPGILSIFFKVINNRLNITVVIRSSELLIGWPANIYQVRLLQKYVSEKVEIACGEVTTISHSAHLNEENLDDAKEIVKKLKF